METLFDRLLLRPLPTVDDILQAPTDEILQVGAWLGIYATMDEVEDNELSELPLRVQAGLAELRPLKLSGHVRLDPDNLDRLLRILNHSEVFLRSFTATGSYISAEGLQTPGVSDYVQINMEEILSNGTRLGVVGTLTMNVPRPANIQVLRENLEIAAHLADPRWRGKYSTGVSSRDVYFALEGIQAEAAELKLYLRENEHWHRVRDFRSVPEANHDFLIPYLRSKLQTPVAMRLVGTNTEGTAYALQYRIDALALEQRELYDQYLLLELERLLSPTGFLRYFATTTNPLEQVFLALEDLLPASDTYLVAPSDRALQRYYAQIQGYEEEEAFRQVLLRRREFFNTRKITHRLQQRWVVDNRSAAFHVLGHYWSKLHEVPVPVLEGDLLTVCGNVLSVKDALALYILMLQAQQQAARPLHCYLKWLAGLEGDQLPSELVTYFDEAPRDRAEEQPRCSVPSDKYYVAAFSPQRYSPKLLRQKGDVVLCHYWREGKEERYFSLYSEKLYYPEDLRDCCSFQLPTSHVIAKQLPTTVISSQDYKFDITMVGEYYRLDIVAIADDKPMDRWTLFHVPIWVKLEYPQLLDVLLWRWKRGHILTQEAQVWYRHTRKLWGASSTALAYQELTPEFWRSLTSEQALEQTAALVR
jgi:hypothetical protein